MVHPLLQVNKGKRMDILLNNDRTSLDFGDAICINGPLTTANLTVDPASVVAQRLRIRLQTFLGEWFLQTSYGIPYFQRTLGKKTSKTAVDRIFQEQILQERGVRELVSFSSTLQNRQYAMSFRVRALNGDVTESITVNTNI